MITERLELLSEELNTDFTFTVDCEGNITDFTILEEQDGVNIPRFAILVDEFSSEEKYVLSVLESPLIVHFGTNLGDTIRVFVSSDIEEVFQRMKEEVLRDQWY